MANIIPMEPIKMFSLADLYMAADQMQQNKINNQIAQMKLNELTRQIGDENTARKIFAESVTPGTPAQPQTGTGADITLNAPPANMLAYNLNGAGAKVDSSFSLGNISMTPPSKDYSSAKPATSPQFNPSTAVNKLYAAGMPEKAMEMQQGMQAQEQQQVKNELDAFKAAGDSGNAQAAQNIWNSGFFGKKYGPIESYSIKGEKRESTATVTQAGIDLLKQHPELTDIQRETVNNLRPGDRIKAVATDNGKKIESIEVVKPEGAHNTVTIRGAGGKPMVMQYNPQTGKYDKPVGEAVKQAGIFGELSEEDQAKMDKLAKAAGEGRLNPKLIPAFGKGRTEFINSFMNIYPQGDEVKLEANIKYMTDPQNMKTRAYVKTLLPRYEQLRDKADAMKNSDIVSFNKVANWWSQQTGKPEVVDFNSLKNALVQEAESAMTGGNSVTDIRLKMGVENIQSANSPAQLSVAIDNYENALKAKSEAASDVQYPWSEVRGEAPAAPANQPPGGKGGARPPLSAIFGK